MTKTVPKHPPKGRKPGDYAVWDELTATRWTVDSQGRVVLEPKDDLQDRIGRPLDRADAVAMVFCYTHGRGHVPDQHTVTWGEWQKTAVTS